MHSFSQPFCALDRGLRPDLCLILHGGITCRNFAWFCLCTNEFLLVLSFWDLLRPLIVLGPNTSSITYGVKYQITVSHLALDQISLSRLEVSYSNYYKRVTRSVFVAAALHNIIFDSPSPVGIGNFFLVKCCSALKQPFAESVNVCCMVSDISRLFNFAHLHKTFEDP